MTEVSEQRRQPPFEPDARTPSRGRTLSRWAAWQCPQCGHVEQQLAAAVAVGHRCKRARRLVELVREPESVSLAWPTGGT
jgi:hypothetical protein